MAATCVENTQQMYIFENCPRYILNEINGMEMIERQYLILNFNMHQDMIPRSAISQDGDKSQLFTYIII